MAFNVTLSVGIAKEVNKVETESSLELNILVGNIGMLFMT